MTTDQRTVFGRAGASGVLASMCPSLVLVVASVSALNLALATAGADSTTALFRSK